MTGRTGRMGRILHRPAVVALVAVLLVAALAASVHADLGARQEREQAERDLRSLRARTAQIDDSLRSVRALIERSTSRARDDEAEAKLVDTAVARIQQVRTEIAATAAELRQASEAESANQGAVGQVRACWDTLETAIAGLQADPADPAGAARALRDGESSCTAALELSRGRTGAVHAYDFADPSVLVVGAETYAFGTNGPAGTIQVLHSTDLADWEVRDDALAALPAWARAGHTWAPSVHRVGSTYVLYYAVRARGSGLQCISAATSATPGGPYVDTSSGPLVCQGELGGSIDPDLYTDGFGFSHLVWKSEGAAGQPAQLWSQYVDADGVHLVGQPFLMLTADQAWQGGVIENPSMVFVDGVWLLVHSGNRWDSADYRTGYAVCASENGPCLTPQDSILLTDTEDTVGPGGAQVFRASDGGLRVVWAAWDRGHVGFPDLRRLHVGRFSMVGGNPRITEG